MHETRLFYTPVWRDDLDVPESNWTLRRELMLNRITALAAEGLGVQKTNFGGWQSPDDLYRYPEFQWLIGRVMALGNEIAPAFSAKQRFDDGILWANVNRRGDFNAVQWDAKKDFASTPRVLLNGWEQLVQVLMLSNEFLFVD